MIRGQVKGLKKLGDNIKELSKQVGTKKAVRHLRPVIRNSLKPSLKDLKALTPVDTGLLKTKPKIVVRRPNKGDLKLNPKAVMIGFVGWRWRRADGDTPKDFYKRVLALEYGTKRQPARRIITNIMRRNYRQILRTCEANMGKVIEKVADEISKNRKP